MTTHRAVAVPPVQLRPADLEAIREHGEATFPHECCGLLLGRVAPGGPGTPGAKVVTAIEALPNEREDSRHNRFLITPETFLKADRAARARGLDILGFYHSHPNAPAIPSEFDREHAWPFYSYIIVSVLDGAARDLRSWTLTGDRSRFEPEAVEPVLED